MMWEGVIVTITVTAFLLLLNLSSVDAKSVLRPGDLLNSTWNLVSDNGKFSLGFFKIESTNYSYVGIWHTNDEQGKKVWVGNPNAPLINDPGTLILDSSGKLKIIINGGNSSIDVSDNVMTNNTVAILQDSGNLVLAEDAAANRTVWQSFDRPTNTLLPGMRIGFNRSTGQNWTLVSWLTDDVPASGAFSLGFQDVQGSGQLIVWREGKEYWRSGHWNGQAFQFAPALTDTQNKYRYNINCISDNNAVYLVFLPSEAPLSMLELTSMGQIMDGANNRLVSPYKDFCYGYESDNGCVASPQPSCRTIGEQYEYRNVMFQDSWRTVYDNSSLGLTDCMDICWRDCSCIGFRALNRDTGGCSIWATNDTYNLDDYTGSSSVYTYVLIKSNSSKGSTKPQTWIIIVPVVFVVILVSILFGYLARRRFRQKGKERRRRKEFLRQLTAMDSFNGPNESATRRGEPHDLKIFSFGSIMLATDNFSSENKLGQGGFGSVYKGRLRDGQEIAVKRLSRTSGQGVEQLKNELILISKLQHTNLVRVLGCCIHQEEKMLIYEFMPNKSLDFFLFAPDRRERLDWRTRLDIIEGIAQGLLYLHKHSRMKVIHRDLKASNVLLDENMNPKIADFGMARIFKQNETEVITRKVVGTYGYMSPEYAMEGSFSVKSDVFSFGVLVLELVSGRSNTSFYDTRPLNLIGYAWELWKEGNPLKIKDPLLDDSCDANQILRAIHIGLLCVQENPGDRPKMQDVTAMLSSESTCLPSPKHPAFFTGRRIPHSAPSIDEEKGNSIQDFIITQVEAR